MKAKIMKTTNFHKMKYDLKGHTWGLTTLVIVSY